MPERVDIAYLRALTEKLHRDRLITSCLTCDHFMPHEEMCNLTPHRPPARVIALGCPMWDDQLKLVSSS